MTAAAGNGPYVTKPSSGLVWLNHFTTGGVFVIYLSRGLQELESADLQVLLKARLAFFLAYTAMPILNHYRSGCGAEGGVRSCAHWPAPNTSGADHST